MDLALARSTSPLSRLQRDRKFSNFTLCLEIIGAFFIFVDMKLDILAFGAHPDDVELGAGGTLAKEAALGKKTGVIDLTRGEMGTRGTPEIRDAEAQEAGKILGLSIRSNLNMSDGFFLNNRENQEKIARVIRIYQPEIVIANALDDRHPDHGRASQLVSDACFLSGLRKWEISDENGFLAAWRPKAIYHYMQFRELKPELIVDISDYNDQKMKSVLAHKSQFFNPNSQEPETVIASKGFLDSISYRAMNYGRLIGVEFGEAFNIERPLGSSSLSELI